MSIAEKLTTVAQNQQKVFDAGKTAEWSSFWDVFQENGQRVVYANAFWGGFSDVNFKPKYDMRPTTLNYAFQNTPITDLKGIFQQQGVVFDTANCTNFSHCFNSASVTHLPVIDTRSSTAVALQYMFYQAKDLVSIEKLTLKDDGSQNFSYTFSSCSALENIVIEGCIGTNLNISYSSKLTHDSLLSILNALKDYSGTGETYKLTLGTTNLGKLADSEIAIATEKGWTLA